MKDKNTRQLAVIMFTDIVGYTALMQANEKLAAKSRARHREVFEQLHQKHLGEIIQYYGDGTLSVFKSVIEAVNCAISIQECLQKGLTVPLRIGLHLGDIVFDATEVYGDAVNFASRIENLGTAGSILLSKKINDELKNQETISTTSLGVFEFKNIDKPAEVFAISNKGIKIPTIVDVKRKQKKLENTIAVLPFVNLSDSTENEYFSDGITEEIINALAKIKNLKVTSRTSSFFFKGKNLPIPEIGAELGVSSILEGSVRLAGNAIRITAQLIQVEEDYHFWSDTWDRKLENVFEIQDEVSLLIADKLREHFGHLEFEESLVSKPTADVNAYGYCLKAKFHENKWNPEDTNTAIALYEKALELDPKYADAHLGLANCISFLGTISFIPFEEAWQKTSMHTNKALELNGQSSGVHYQLSNQAFFIECDYAKSLLEMKKAIEINPNNAEAQQFISFLYIIAGEKEKSRQHLDIAWSINPLSEETLFFKAYFHYMLEDYEYSLQLLNKCLEGNDKSIPAHSVKAICLLKLNRYEEAIHYFDALPAEVVVEGDRIGIIAMGYALKEDSKNERLYTEKLKSLAAKTEGFTAEANLFMQYAAIGENDKAFAWVEKALANKSSLLLLKYSDPLVNSLKKDPRYDAFQKIIYKTEGTKIKSKKKTQLLTTKQSEAYADKLLNYLLEDRAFLNADLSLRELANNIEMHPNNLSWLLNNFFGKNYNEFINAYRVEEFKRKVKEPKNADLTIEGLAYESGFNSKTVFNSYFKKETGLTPKQFLKQHN
ncbi:tetratricopeptide repeat protein [Flavicella sediminum]|uniref:tetratricopeptide repeat protein n=1 Tax=Flavicella sediminum TaxID=2585141 RepID=UPI001120546B|nr:tetratricopeptide repeat protein [Flavicella sediminum]